jgi:hypothetical protein
MEHSFNILSAFTQTGYHTMKKINALNKYLSEQYPGETMRGLVDGLNMNEIAISILKGLEQSNRTLLRQLDRKLKIVK